MVLLIGGGLDTMPRIMGGDLVISGGIKFHIKYSGGGEVQYWAEDTKKTHVESFEMFMSRCEQHGNIIIKPGEGKFGDDEEWDGREEYREVVNS